jgi:hypothetical protein
MPNNTIEAIPTLAKIVNGLPDLNGMVRRLIFPGKREIVK